MKKQLQKLTTFLKSTVIMTLLLICAATTHAQTDSLVTFTTWADSARYFQEFSNVFDTLAGDDTVYLAGISEDSIVGENDGYDSGGNFCYYSQTDGNVHFNGPGTLTGLLSNDVHADSFAYLTVLHGAGTLNVTQGGNSTVAYYTPAAGEGWQMILLSYVPYNKGSGKFGHPTFIFLLVTHDPTCNSTSCELVENGVLAPSAVYSTNPCGVMYDGIDFSYSVAVGPAALCNWTQWASSPDVYAGSGCTIYSSVGDGSAWPFTVPTPASVGTPAFSANYPTSTAESLLGLGGYAYNYTYSSTTTPSYGDEGVLTQLAAPLIPGVEYILDFWGLVAPHCR